MQCARLQQRDAIYAECECERAPEVVASGAHNEDNTMAISKQPCKSMAAIARWRSAESLYASRYLWKVKEPLDGGI